MKKLATLALLCGFAAFSHAADKELTPQQKLMGTCNAEAKGLKGEEHKKKMQACLSDGKKRQQEVMKACAAENKGKKGQEYKDAQKACLSKG